jgi:CDP-diacylglycerol---glycerol-3-phosphate 3-phosphatidyltransferase
MLAALPPGYGVPAWMVVVLLSREMIITGLRSLAALQGIVVPASESAKHKTAWTFIAIIALLIEAPGNFFGMAVDFHKSGMVFLWIALIFSVHSGMQYAIRLRHVFDEK